MSIDKSNQPKSSNAEMGKSLSLKTKATLLAIALGTIPVLATGGTAYYFANKSITKETISNEELKVSELQDKVGRFIKERRGDIQVISSLKVLVNPEKFTFEDRSEILKRFYEAYGTYESLAAFDLNWNVIAQSDEGKKLENHLDRPYVQEALKTQKTVISQPTISKSTGKYSIYSASAIKDPRTGKIIGFARARLPVSSLTDIVKNYQSKDQQYYLVNSTGEVFLGGDNEASKNGQEEFMLKDIFADLPLVHDQSTQQNATASIHCAPN
jgi:methyl-accepting chemotaxis protein PixJ